MERQSENPDFKKTVQAFAHAEGHVGKNIFGKVVRIQAS